MKAIIENYDIKDDTLLDPYFYNKLLQRSDNSVSSIFQKIDDITLMEEIQPAVLLNNTYSDVVINESIDITNYRSFRLIYDIFNTNTVTNVSGGIAVRYNNDSTASRYQGVQFNGIVNTFGTSATTSGFGASYNEFKMEQTTTNAVTTTGNLFHADMIGFTAVNFYRLLFAKFYQKRGNGQSAVFGEWYYKYNSTANAITTLNIYSTLRHTGNVTVIGL